MLLVLFGRIVQILVSLLALRVATTVLSPEEMGRMSLLTAAFAFFSLSLINPVGMFINRRLHQWESRGVLFARIRGLGMYLILVSLLAIVILSLAQATGWLGVKTSIGWLVFLSFGILVCGTLGQTYVPALNMLEHRQDFVVLQTGIAIGSVIFAYVIGMWLGNSAETWLSGAVVANALMGLMAARRLRSKTRGSSEPLIQFPNSAQRNAVLRFSLPLALSVGFSWAQTQSYRFIADDLIGLAELGLFVAGYGVSAGVLAAFESVLTAYFHPRFYRCISETASSTEIAEAWKGYASAVIPPTIVAAAVTIATAWALPHLLLGPQFHGVAPFIIAGAAGECARIVTNVFGMAAHALMNTSLLIQPGVIAAGVAIASVSVLGSWFGVNGVAAALAGAGWICVLALYCMLKRKIDLQLPWRRIAGAGLASVVVIGWEGLFQLFFGRPETIVGILGRLTLAGIVFILAEYRLLRAYLRIPEPKN